MRRYIPHLVFLLIALASCEQTIDPFESGQQFETVITSGTYIIELKSDNSTFDLSGDRVKTSSGSDLFCTIENANSDYFYIKIFGNNLDQIIATDEVIIYPAHNGDNQQWKFIPVHDEYFVVQNKASSEVITSPGLQGNLYCQTRTDDDNQLFRFYRVQ